MGTLLSILAALFILLNPLNMQTNVRTTFLTSTVVAIAVLAVAILFLFLLIVRFLFSWSPLQRAENHFAPRILDLLQQDRGLFFCSAWTILFCLLSFLLAFGFIPLADNSFKWLAAIWIILLGITIDTAMYFNHRILDYLNPFSLIKLFSKRAKQSIQDEKERDLCHWIDGLSEIAIKGLEQNSTSLSHQALDELQGNARLFFESSKSISHHAQDSQTLSMGIGDKVTFVTFYLYQRLDMIFESALKRKFEPTCSHIITLFGKIALDAAKYDISIASVPLRFIGKLSKRAQEEGMEETALKASIVLLEVAKAYASEIDLTYLEIKDPYLSIINGMEQLAKGVFKRDKNYNLSILMEPFKELKQLFQTEKLQNHADTPVIMQNIDRVIGEFEQLQMVMKTIPPLPDLGAGNV